MHELFGNFALSLLEGTRIDNSGQSDVFSALKCVVRQCTVACIADVERGRRIGRKGKKGDASFSLRGGLLKGKEKGFCMSALTPCLLFISQITDFHFVSFHFVSQITVSLRIILFLRSKSHLFQIASFLF